MTISSGTALVALFIAMLGIGGIVALHYQRWIADCTRRLEGGSKLADTPMGHIEYASFGTRGPAILFVHGQPGGYDQGKLFVQAALQHGFRIITFSRPGYLRTPLEVGRSPEEQADAMAALLDALGIDQAAVVSLSGGGPAALQFALRHNERCLALVGISAVSLSKTPPTEIVGRLLSSRLFTSNVAGWLIGTVVKMRPVLLAKALIPDTQLQVDILSDWRKLSALTAIAQAGIQLPAQRRAGSQNDIKQNAIMPIYPVEAIHIPTLVIHGTEDELVPYSHARFVAQGVPNAELYAIESGVHAILVTHTDQVLARLFTFLGEHSEGRPHKRISA